MAAVENNGNNEASNQQQLHPFVLWGQKDQDLYLTVQLQGVKDPVINLNESKLTFCGRGYGCHGTNVYQFDLDLYLPVQRKLSSWQVKEKCIEFHLLKESAEIWPRLTHNKQRLAWIKVNFDLMQFSDDSNDEEQETPFPKWDSDLAGSAGSNDTGNSKQKLKQAMKQDVDKFFEMFRNPKQLYLFLFNMFQWVGYCVVFFASMLRYTRAESKEDKQSVVNNILPQLCMVQLAAMLEVMHAAVGWVRSGIFATLLQVLGRNMILFLLVLPYKELQQLEIVLWLVVTWSAVEIVRYPYYILATIGQEMPIVTWLRYTIWIPLYPLGFVLEGLVMLAALPRVQEEQWYSLAMPNLYNFAFDFSVFLRCYMLGFLIGAYFLITHMYSQRKRKIGPQPRSQFSKWGLLPFLSRDKQKQALQSDANANAVRKQQ